MSFTSISKVSSQILTVAEKAAIACYDFIGKGDEKAADAAAVESMRDSLNLLDIDGEIVIGEGERDEAPMLYIGEKVGTKVNNAIKIDIALDPLEGTTICATGTPNSLTVIAAAKKGFLLNAPDVYMEKIAVGPNLPKNVVDIESSVKANLTNLALAKKCNISELKVVILKRPRHEKIIADIRQLGAKIKLIPDGDIAGVINCALGDSDIYIGSGGAPEGVLAAAALRTIGGQIFGKLQFNEDEQKVRAKKMGISDLNKIYSCEEMTGGKESEVIFACSGVTDGDLLKGVKKYQNKIIVNSFLMDSSCKKFSNILTEYLY